MNYHGDIALDDAIDIWFATRNAGGVLTTLAGTPAVAAVVGNSGTPVTGGITLNVDHRGTGLHHVRVVASNANGYSVGTNVQLFISAGTVGGVSVVSEPIASFSIEYRTTAFHKRVYPTIDGMTFEELMQVVLAALAGKASGMGTTTGIFRDVDDTKDVITATIDSDGNRTAVTLNP